MRRVLLFSALACVFVVGGVAANRSSTAEKSSSTAAAPDHYNVGALGRIEPQSEVIKVNAPSVMEPPVVEKLLVDVGDRVHAGQVLAILDSHRRELADVEGAKSAVLLAERSLAQVKAGAKAGDIAAQEELIARTKERLLLAEKQLERYRRLRESKALSEDDLDIRKTDVDVLQRELRQHENTLTALREIRPVDIEHAEAEVAQARAMLQRAEADLEISFLRSPIDGEILRINCRIGERIGDDGLLDLGDTSQMDVVAEVHESDILKVRLYQPTKVFLRNLNETLNGHVIEVGRIVGRKDVLSSDPVDDTDARVVEVRVRLDDEHGQRVSGMSYARVEVTIDTSTPAGGSLKTSASNDCNAADSTDPPHK